MTQKKPYLLFVLTNYIKLTTDLQGYSLLAQGIWQCMSAYRRYVHFMGSGNSNGNCLGLANVTCWRQNEACKLVFPSPQE